MNQERENYRAIETEFDTIISVAVSDYGDHEGVNRPKVIRWIAQFPINSRRLATKVLSKLTYYSASNIRRMATELVTMVYQDYKNIDKNHIIFVPVGPPGSGSQIIARHIRSLANVPNSCVVDLFKLQNLSKDEVEVIILFDDFSGTGQTIKEWWERVDQIILPFESEVMLGILVLNQKARNLLESSLEKILAIKDLEDRDNVFHENSVIFTNAEKTELLTLCRATRCPDKFKKGYGDCGLLVVFRHGCPNNSLPILWIDNPNHWEGLFQRRNV